MTFECVGANKRFRPLLQHVRDASTICLYQRPSAGVQTDDQWQSDDNHLQHSLDAIAKRIRKEEAFSMRTRSERAAWSVAAEREQRSAVVVGESVVLKWCSYQWSLAAELACSGERLVASCGLSWPLPCRVPAKMRLVHALAGSDAGAITSENRLVVGGDH